LSRKFAKSQFLSPSLTKILKTFSKSAIGEGPPNQQSTNCFYLGYLYKILLFKKYLWKCLSRKFANRQSLSPALTKSCKLLQSQLGEDPPPNNLVIATTQDICVRYIYLRNSCENVCPQSLQMASPCPQRSQKAANFCKVSWERVPGPTIY
jgi:hypothetical protein